MYCTLKIHVCKQLNLLAIVINHSIVIMTLCSFCQLSSAFIYFIIVVCLKILEIFIQFSR